MLDSLPVLSFPSHDGDPTNKAIRCVLATQRTQKRYFGAFNGINFSWHQTCIALAIKKQGVFFS